MGFFMMAHDFASIGFLSPILMMALDDLKTGDDPEPMFNRFMGVVGTVLPAHMFTDAVTKMTDTSRFNSYCKHNYDMCAMLPYFSEGFDKEKCCSKHLDTDFHCSSTV